MRSNKSKINRKNIIFGIITILIPLLILETFFRISSVKQGHTLRLLGKYYYNILPLGIPDSSIIKSSSTNNNEYVIFDSTLGWKLKNNGASPPLYYASSQGFRISRDEFLMDKNIDSADIITIGNSFTHGEEVLHENSWPYILGKMSNKTVVNLGVSGYGIDQAILRYMHSSIKTDMVILGIVPDDFDRATKILYRGIYYGGLVSKPMFQFQSNGEYNIVNQPCLIGIDLLKEFNLGIRSDFMKLEKNYDDMLFKNEFMDYSILYRILKMFRYRNNYVKPPIYHRDSEDSDYKYILSILNVFFNECQKNKVSPIIVLFDIYNHIMQYDQPWKNMIHDINKIGFLVVEPQDSIISLYKIKPNSVINDGGNHFTPMVNELIAKNLHNQIR